jgi:hypothetical protein
MNPLFKQLYKHKKTRTRDPNAPPPPNLFSTVKDLKDTKSVVDLHTATIYDMQAKITKLEHKTQYLESYIGILRNQLRRK